MTSSESTPVNVKVIVGICTYKRPVMLKKCLDSIFAQEKPSGWDVEIVIVDNDAESNLSNGMDFSNAPYKVHYFGEAQRGISYARNAVCRHALELGGDYLLFLDDDEEAEPGWLLAYHRGSQQFEAEAYTGPVRNIFPEGYQEWLGNKGLSDTKHGSLLRRAATNNVMLATRILNKPGEPLEFDTRMALMGGEDKDFFMRLVHRGGRIVYLSDAVVSEVVMANRLTISWRLKRQYQSSANSIYIDSKLYGPRKIRAVSIKELLRHILEGSLGLIISPLLLLGGYRKFKRGWYHGLRHFAKAAGIIAGLRGSYVQLYAKTDGY